PLLPKQVRYQAAPHPEVFAKAYHSWSACGFRSHELAGRWSSLPERRTPAGADTFLKRAATPAAGAVRRRAALRRDTRGRTPPPRHGDQRAQGCRNPFPSPSEAGTLRGSSAEKPPRRLQGQAAMTHAGLLLVGGLGERPAERRIEEHGIVAETAAASRRFGDQPLGHAFHHLLRPRRARDRDDTAEARGAPSRSNAA